MNKRASGVLMHVSSLPGVPNGNWAFRVTQEQLDGIDKNVAQRIKRRLLQKQITAKGRRVSVGFCLANF